LGENVRGVLAVAVGIDVIVAVTVPVGWAVGGITMELAVDAAVVGVAGILVDVAATVVEVASGTVVAVAGGCVDSEVEITSVEVASGSVGVGGSEVEITPVEVASGSVGVGGNVVSVIPSDEAIVLACGSGAACALIKVPKTNAITAITIVTRLSFLDVNIEASFRYAMQLGIKAAWTGESTERNFSCQ
jgi:hypothetical protein